MHNIKSKTKLLFLVTQQQHIIMMFIIETFTNCHNATQYKHNVTVQ